VFTKENRIKTNLTTLMNVLVPVSAFLEREQQSELFYSLANQACSFV